MSKEFLQASEAFAKRARRLAIGCEVNPLRDHSASWVGHVDMFRPFVPRWLLIEPWDGMMIEDVKFGAQSQLGGHQPVSAALYSVTDAQKLFESPESPAWDRFKFEAADRMPLTPGNGRIQVQLSFRMSPPPHTINCVFLGDEPSHRNWEIETRGTLVGVSITGNGPMVEVHLSDGFHRHPDVQPVRIPVKPSDIPLLVDRIGRPVRFKLQTEE